MNLKKGQSITLEEALSLSLYLAKKGRGLVEPNPYVGAVLFNEKKKELISWGYHEYYGGPHAEVNCLKDIKEASKLTLVVSLEPCSHFGKTHPCANLVISKKVSKLVYIEKDPNPLVSGKKGLERIKESGIEVVSASKIYKKDHQILNDKFLYAFKNKRSYVHLKWAQSSNAKLSYKNESTPVTDPKTQLEAHYLRAQSQMVVVGINTILQDDPKLNVRLKGYEKNLMVGVLDPNLELLDKLKNKKISKIRPKGLVYLITNKNLKRDNIITIAKTPKGELDLKDLTQKTYSKLNIQSLFVEGGAYTLRAFIDQNVYNRVSIYESKKKLNEKNSIGVFNTKDLMDSFLNRNLNLIEERNMGNRENIGDMRDMEDRGDIKNIGGIRDIGDIKNIGDVGDMGADKFRDFIRKI